MLSIHVAALLSSANALTFPPSFLSVSAAGGLIPERIGQVPLSPDMQKLTDAFAAETKTDWPSLDASKFPERIDAAIAAAKSDPCNAEVLSNGFSYQWGFGARAFMAANELQVAAYFNKSVAFCDGSLRVADVLRPEGTIGEGIHYEGLFASSIGICNDLEVCHTRTDLGSVQPPSALLGHEMTISIRLVNYDSAARMLSASYQALFGTFNTETQALVEAAHLQAGLQTGVEYVGVHIRRGDKYKELKNVNLRFNTTEEYAGVVSTQLKRCGLNTVYLASDDTAAQAELLAALRPSIPNVKIIQSFTPASASRSYVVAQDTGELSFLADVVALRDAAVFIGTQSSGTSRLVRFIRPENSISISTDGDWLNTCET